MQSGEPNVWTRTPHLHRRPRHRLVAQDAGIPLRRHGFDSRWGRQENQYVNEDSPGGRTYVRQKYGIYAMNFGHGGQRRAFLVRRHTDRTEDQRAARAPGAPLSRSLGERGARALSLPPS